MFDKRLMQMCPGSRKYIAANVFIQWLGLVMNALIIAVIAATAEQLYKNTLSVRELPLRLFVIFTAAAVRFITIRGAAKMSYLASRTVKRIIREKIYIKLLCLGSSYREHSSTAELVQESVEGVEQLESYFGQYVPQFFYAFLAPLTLFFMFSVAGSFKAASILLLCVPLIPAAIMMVQKFAKKLLSGYWAQYTQLGSAFLENLQGMTTLKIYQADEYKNEQMNLESEHFRIVTMKVLTMQLNSIIIMDLVAYGGAAIGIILAVSAFFEGSLSIASCLFMILLSADFFLPMRRLGSCFHIAMNGMAASDRIFHFLAEEEPKEKTSVFPESGGELQLKAVHFRYSPEREVLHGISMEIRERSFVGIVGESGSGKSTVASLIMGRNTPTGGKIMISGSDIRDISEESMFRSITYVGLGSVFFKGNIRENLLLADPKADDEMLWKILEECSAADFLRAENGLETQLSENASNLSGGQKQRIALARALLHNSPIYIFDEATSNIDTESEEAILSEIRSLSKKKTVIMITHRLANVTDADLIYCMDNGHLAGKGTHADLLAECYSYKKLWDTQRELETFGKDVHPE